MTRPVKGQRFVWRDAVYIEVIRVAKDGSWADLRCEDWNREPWSKRQRLPFPEGTVRRP